MLFMIIERFKNGDAIPVYQRYRDRGRLVPDGLRYVSSWVDTRMQRCYQVMETDDPALIEQWTAKDPLPRFQKAVIDRGGATPKDFADIDKMTKDYAATEADIAVDEPMPDPATVSRGVYAGDDFAVPRVELVKSPWR